MRVPRLCTMYHNKIKGISEAESAQILEKIYNEWYVAVKSAQPLKESPDVRQKTKSPTNTSPERSPEQKKMSKIEEALLDRSPRQTGAFPSRLSTKAGGERTGGAESPSHLRMTKSSRAKVDPRLYQSQDSHAWANNGTRGSTIINPGQIRVKPMFNFGKAPNTAGEVLTGAFDTSQEGIFTGIPNRLQHSINFGRAVTGSRESDFQTI